MIKHHPDIERLAAFSAGTLPLSHSLCISAHLEQCSQCREAVKRMNHIGSELMGGLPDAAISPQLKDNIMSRIKAQTETVVSDTQSPAVNAVINAAEHQRVRTDVPKGLQKLLPDGLQGIEWKRKTSSLYGATLCTDIDGTRIEMIKMKAGGKAARHRHSGEEITIVLEGSFSDEDSNYLPGDIIFRGKDAKPHKPIASQDRDCICLVAVEAPIQLTSLLGRLLNPILRRNHYAT